MNYHGRSKISSRRPQAQAVCDRCFMTYNHVDLQNQPFWAGSNLAIKNILVCRRCLDVPNAQLMALALSADPVPIVNPRTYDWQELETNNRVTQDGNNRVTQNNQSRVTQMTGEPPGGLNQMPGTDPGGLNNPIGIPYDFDEVPKTGPLD